MSNVINPVGITAVPINYGFIGIGGVIMIKTNCCKKVRRLSNCQMNWDVDRIECKQGFGCKKVGCEIEMTLIKKDPVGNIHIEYSEDGRKIRNMKFEFPELEMEQPCYICKKMTKKTRMGFTECDECQKYEECCDDCENMVCRSSIHNLGDPDEHVSQWTACGIRKLQYDKEKGYWYKILSEKDDKSDESVNNISIEERKKCFKPRDPKNSRYCPMRLGNIPLSRCKQCGYNKKYNTDEIECNYK